MKQKEPEQPKQPCDMHGVVCSFSPWDYAEDAFKETLNHMSEEELSEIDNFDNEDSLREYLSDFFERT